MKRNLWLLVFLFLMTFLVSTENVNAEWKIKKFESDNLIDFDSKTGQIIISYGSEDSYWYHKNTKKIITKEELEKLSEDEQNNYNFGSAYYMTDDFKKGDYAYADISHGCGDVDQFYFLLSMYPETTTIYEIRNVNYSSETKDYKIVKTNVNNKKIDYSSEEESDFYKSDGKTYDVIQNGIYAYDENTKAIYEVVIVEEKEQGLDKPKYAIVGANGKVLYDFSSDFTLHEKMLKKDGEYYYLNDFGQVIIFKSSDYSLINDFDGKNITDAYLEDGESNQIYKYTDSSLKKSYFIKNNKVLNNKSYGENAYITKSEQKFYIIDDTTIYNLDGTIFKSNFSAIATSGDFVFALDARTMYVYKNGELIITDNGLIYDKENFKFISVINSSDGKYFGWNLDLSCGEGTDVVVLINTDSINEEYTYEFTEGANQKFEINTSKSVIFKINGNHELFKEIYIDGNLVSVNNYIVTKGSTIITLNDDYAKQLADGKEHSIKVVYTNGKEVSTTFKVEEKIGNPHTGEALSVIFIGSLIGIAVFVKSKKKSDVLKKI